MTTTIDVEDLHTTKSEKLLALVMTVFLLIGGVWTYQRLDDTVRNHVRVGEPSGADREAIQRAERARERLFLANNAVARARSELTVRRERYRTALEAKRPADTLRRQYLAADARYTAEQGRRSDAQRAVSAAEPAAAAAERRVASHVGEQRRKQDRIVFALRFALVLAALAAGYVLLARLRRRNSRYLPLAGALLASGTIMAFVLAGDYVTDYVEPFQWGILVLAAIGVAATVVAFWVLQRYLARRLPRRRVQRAQCPFCGFDATRGEHCEGCGRTVVAPCARCSAPRRVGAPFCAACGNP